MIETAEKTAAGTPDLATAGKRPFDFSSWTNLPPLSAPKPQGRETATSGPGPLERATALLLIAMAAPALLPVALAIKIESPHGPVFYRQERVGLNRRCRSASGNGGNGRVPAQNDRRKSHGHGRPFLVWKFRTMIPDAEARTGAVWAMKDDPRITRVGRLLRQSRLDELPQLINVLKGDMRLIGPRPERPQFVEKLTEVVPDYARRQTVPPGITGLAQVQRSYDSDLNDVRTKLKYDLFYVENRSAMMDLKILMKTVDVVVRGRGAH